MSPHELKYIDQSTVVGAFENPLATCGHQQHLCSAPPRRQQHLRTHQKRSLRAQPSLPRSQTNQLAMSLPLSRIISELSGIYYPRRTHHQWGIKQPAEGTQKPKTH
eukprot:4770873-Amphidinium_carterae.1